MPKSYEQLYHYGKVISRPGVISKKYKLQMNGAKKAKKLESYLDQLAKG